MDKRTALREWRNVTKGSPEEGLPITSRAVHAFAQRVEALAIAGADKRHEAMRNELNDAIEALSRA